MIRNYFRPILALYCWWKGHRFGKPRLDTKNSGMQGDVRRVKFCKRCTLEREVKQRARKVAA